MFSDLIKIAFPKNCIGCSHSLNSNEKFLCSNCYFYFPKGEASISINTETGQLFDSIPTILGASHLFYFDKDGKTQKVLHELKYKKNLNFGEYLGELMGVEFQSSLEDVDLVIPVPLHPKKEHQRGFNQSTLLCNGISTVIQKPVSTEILIRTRFTETQTKKNREERIQNIKNAFELLNKKELQDKTILLVDDVITTGSTLIECVNELNKAEGVRIKILLLAKASD